MRALGFALVTASILLGSGGVVYRRPALAQEPAVSPAGPEEPAMCRAQATQLGVKPEPRYTRIAAPELAGRVVSLGTRGFNYSRPGDPTPSAVRPAGEAPAAPRH